MPLAAVPRDQQPSEKLVVFSAGGSGGHAFPALAMAQALKKRGIESALFGHGTRALREQVTNAGLPFYELPAAKWSGRNIFRKIWVVFILIRAVCRAIRLLRHLKPAAVCGVGGYASVSTVLAAKILRIPTMIHDQNVQPGRANRLLMKGVDKVAISFAETMAFIPEKTRSKAILTGNPLREIVWQVRKVERPETDDIHLLIVGGSQGARILSRVVPEAIKLMKENIKNKLHVAHQARPEDLETALQKYARAGVDAQVLAFFDDLPKRMRQSHLVIARAGASTVAEMVALGRTGIFVPLTLAEGHQYANAQVMINAHAAEIMEEKEFTPERLAERLTALINDPGERTRREKNAEKLANPGAAERLADVLEGLFNS